MRAQRAQGGGEGGLELMRLYVTVPILGSCSLLPLSGLPWRRWWLLMWS